MRMSGRRVVSQLSDRQEPRRVWARLRRLHWYKPPLTVVSLSLFVLAIGLMKEGAGHLGPLVRDRFAVTTFTDGLGFGWLFSYVIMSGSPVAGAALALLDNGVLDRLGAYGMIVGSRFGGSFIVLLIGFLYVVRGKSRTTSLSMGILSMAVAASIQVAAIPIGLYLLHGGMLDGIQIQTPASLTDVVDAVIAPIVSALEARLPGWAVFVAGLGLIMASFSLFDRCLPEMTLKETSGGAISRYVYRPWVMFLLGSAVTLVSMSVSISLGLLVPLSQRGLVRRENVVPYIMGANISTFIDTLIAAVLISNPEAFTVVLVEVVSLSIVAVLILLASYATYERWLLHFVTWSTASRRNLGAFLAVICIVPMILLAF
jgi:solute carrier family 34 (sodium-dependent phosphate cotransporter)